jgi:hypothetical protein
MRNLSIKITAVATKFKWYMLRYPESNECYWALMDDNDKVLADGNHNIPQEVIDTWGTDDGVISEYLINTAKVGQ